MIVNIVNSLRAIDSRRVFQLMFFFKTTNYELTSFYFQRMNKNLIKRNKKFGALNERGIVKT